MNEIDPTQIIRPKPDFGESVRGGGKIFRGGATMISRTEQQMCTVYTNLVFTQTLRSRAYNHYAPKIMAFYTFLFNLYNCLLKFISLTILLEEVLKISEEVQSHPRGGAHLPPKSGLAFVSSSFFSLA